MPRFTPEARAANLAVGDLLKRIAEQKHATPAANRARMAAGAEALDRTDPGTTKLHRLEENLGAVNVTLTADDLHDIEGAASMIPIQGARLPEAILKLSNG